MAYTYSVTSKTKDPTNGNIVVTATFVDDQNPGVTYTDKTFAFDLTDAAIDNWARNKIAVFTKRDQNFEGITLVTGKTPAAIDPALETLSAAQKAFSLALTAAQVAELDDAALTTAYGALVTAQTAVEQVVNNDEVIDP